MRKLPSILEGGSLEFWRKESGRFFFWYERGKFPFGKTKIEKKYMGSFGEEEVFFEKGDWQTHEEEGERK